MRCFVGLDVSLDKTSVCVIDDDGLILREAEVASEPAAISAFLTSLDLNIARIGLESGALGQWLFVEMAKAAMPVICIEARHAHGFLKTTRNKTDKNDARGIATIMRTGIYRSVHVKTPESQRLRALLTARRLLKTKAVDLENAIGGILRVFGLKVRRVKARLYEDQIRRLVSEEPSLQAVILPLLTARAATRAQYEILDKQVESIAGGDPICRRLMTAPGVGPIAALAYRIAIDIPERFRHSRTVGAHLGLTPRTKQSGKVDYRGRISCFGDSAARAGLFSAAHVLLNPRIRSNWLQAWGQSLVERRGAMKARVAVARRLAIVLHRMWMDQTDFRTSAAEV